MIDDRDIVISSRENYERVMDENERLKDLLKEFIEVCQLALPFLNDHVCMTIHDGPADRIALDKMEQVIAKATGKPPYGQATKSTP